MVLITVRRGNREDFPVSSVEDPLLGSSKRRPQRASRTVKPLMGHGSGRERARQFSHTSITRVLIAFGFDFGFEIKFDFDFGFLNIKVVVDCLFSSKGAPLVPYDPELRKTIRKMVNAQELEAQRLRFGLEAETVARGVQPNVVNN
uniref:Uncharacterized protein n=1 Tax=Solanum tuberosum TaxID=4113 RepID=M1DDH5_SOLTU